MLPTSIRQEKDINTMTPFKLFYEERFDDLKDQRLAEMRQKVQSDQSASLLGADEAEYVQRLVARFVLKPLVLHFDRRYISSKEVSVRAEEFPGGGFEFDGEPGRSYRKQAIAYHIPFEGEEKLLRCRPDPFGRPSLPAYVAGQTLSFDIVDFYGDAGRLESAARENVDLIRTQHGILSEKVEAFNAALPEEARAAFAARRAQWAKQSDLVAALGLPVKRDGTDDLA
jgi:hypothetical protein